MKKKIISRSFFLTLLLLILIFLDQFTKSLTLEHLLGKQPISLIDGVLKLQFVGNKGIAWGMFSGKVDLLIISTGVTILFISFLLIKAIMRMYFFVKVQATDDTNKDIPLNIFRLGILQIVLVFLIAGAIGNFIDRLSLGYVVDMIYFELIDFPVFNVADIFITLSTIIFIILYAFIFNEEEIFELFKSSKKWSVLNKDDSKNKEISENTVE